MADATDSIERQIDIDAPVPVTQGTYVLKWDMAHEGLTWFSGKGVQTRVLDVHDLEYNLDTLEVRRQGKLVQLNPTALKILQALMEASPAVVTRQDLETRVWGEELPDSDSLRVHIHGLRAVIDKPFDVPLIQTRHGIGYRIAAPDGAG